MSGRRGLIRGARPGARKAALFVAIIGTAAATALFIVSMVAGAGEADEYGRVKLPGKGTVELPEGKVALYYEERVTLNENESLDLPDGLRVVARREETVKSEKAIQNAVNLQGRSLREWGKLEIPQAGEYRVTVRSSSPGSNRPAITFGKSQLEGLGKTALLCGAIEGGGLLLALILLLLGRRGYEGERSSFPVPATAPLPSPPPPRAPVARPAMPPATTGDPVEVQLRELERQHKAGALSDEDYAARRRQVLDSAFGSYS